MTTVDVYWEVLIVTRVVTFRGVYVTQKDDFTEEEVCVGSGVKFCVSVSKKIENPMSSSREMLVAVDTTVC